AGERGGSLGFELPSGAAAPGADPPALQAAIKSAPSRMTRQRLIARPVYFPSERRLADPNAGSSEIFWIRSVGADPGVCPHGGQTPGSAPTIPTMFPDCALGFGARGWRDTWHTLRPSWCRQLPSR